MNIKILFYCLIFTCFNVSAQDNTINPELLKGTWPSNWITCPGVAQRAYGVYHFRKSFDLATKPQHFTVHVSADNRYRLFVNGTAICFGPARGDLYNWYFETIDIAPYLRAGKNTLAPIVWNMGEYAAVAQISNQTAFVLQGDAGAESIVNTNASWKVFQDKAYQPCSLDNGRRLHSYMVIGPGDSLNAKSYPWGWEEQNYNDATWQSSVTISRPVTLGYGTDNLWTLTPRTIPLLEETLQRIPVVRRYTGIDNAPGFLSGKNSFTIPANSAVSILLDQSYNTLAYPELIVSDGRDATIKLSYAEALFDAKGAKGNRNEIEGKQLVGNYDIYIADGGTRRLFRPLWQRTYRLQLIQDKQGCCKTDLVIYLLHY